MECRKFDLTLISAIDLEDVRKIFRMKVHARISISGNQATEKRTPTDKHGGINPAWNFTVNYTVDESMVQHPNTMLVIKLYCKRKLGDRYVGEVHRPLKELYECSYRSGGSALVDYPVQRGSVSSQGRLRFSFRFGEKVNLDKLLLAESFAGWSLRSP